VSTYPTPTRRAEVTVRPVEEVIDRFRAALAARDIIPPVEIIADGRIHRCDAAGRNGKGDAAYLLNVNDPPVGGFENWRDGKGWETWRCDAHRKRSGLEVLALRENARASRREREEPADRDPAGAARRHERRYLAGILTDGDDHARGWNRGVLTCLRSNLRRQRATVRPTRPAVLTFVNVPAQTSV
jgi:hypothetical protein